MVFFHGKLRDSVDISKAIAAEQYSSKLSHVTLYVSKTLRKFKSLIKDKPVTNTIAES